MLKWTIHAMLAAPQQLFASIAAVASAFALVLFFNGVFSGESDQIVALIDRTGADVWVMQDGVGNMHMASSFVSDWKLDAVAAVEGVRKVTPILYLNSVIETGDSRWFSFVVGIEPGDPRAGPWRSAGGAALPGPGEAVVPDIFASGAGVGIGDTIRVGGRSFHVAGFSAGTFSMANSITWVSYDDLAEIMSSVDTVSYILVDAAPGVDGAQLAQRIKDEVEEVNALPREALLRRDYSIAVLMGLEIVRMMTVIGGVLALLLTGFAIYSHVADHERDIAVMKALGERNRAIYAAILAQALVIGALAFVLAVLIMLVAIPLTAALIPKISLSLTAAALLNTGVAALAVSLLAAALPLRRILSVDPVAAFHQ